MARVPDLGNDGLEARYGFRLPVREAVEHDLETISKFAPPAGRLLLGFEDGAAVGIGCMRRIGPATAEIKRSTSRVHRGAALAERCWTPLTPLRRRATSASGSTAPTS